MHWTDQGIVLSIKKYGETSGLVRVFAREHGVYGGLVRGMTSKANRGAVQPGNIVTAAWNARLPEHLGTFRIELLEANAALIMQDSARLTALSSACAILESALPERHPYPRLYMLFAAFLAALRDSDDWTEAYVQLELELLADTGFGLDLFRCAATGVTTDLIYVSPKSGRAVSREAGEPYKEKLLPLPHFLLPLSLKGKKAFPLEGGRLDGGDLTTQSRELRTNQTEPEKKLWHYLSQKQMEGYRFRRQHPMGGKYIADFVCLEARLIIELDGESHTHQAQEEYDLVRTAYLESEGFRVLRFWNHEVITNIEGVVTRILELLPLEQSVTPTLTLPPQGGGSLLSPLYGERENTLNPAEILAGMRLTGYFLEHWLLEPHGKRMPAARARLIKLLETELHAADTREAVY